MRTLLARFFSIFPFLIFSFSCLAQFSLPVSTFKLTSGYGTRIHPVLKLSHFHSGIDISASYEPVYSILTGKVSAKGEDRFIGKYVRVSHGKLQSIYGHLSVVLVQEGAQVSSGQLLGISGNSGRTSGPHLHLSIKIFEKFINPLVVIKALLAITINNRMQKDNIAETDKFSLSVMMLLLAEKGRVSLSQQQAAEYGVSVADPLPKEEEGEADEY